MKNANDVLAAHIRLTKLPEPTREHRFCEDRRWRFDFAWPAQKVALEVQGGNWINGRHTRGQGYEQDCEKFSTAAILGWRVLQVTTAMVRDGRAVNWLTEVLI